MSLSLGCLLFQIVPGGEELFKRSEKRKWGSKWNRLEKIQILTVGKIDIFKTLMCPIIDIGKLVHLFMSSVNLLKDLSSLGQSVSYLSMSLLFSFINNITDLVLFIL